MLVLCGDMVCIVGNARSFPMAKNRQTVYFLPLLAAADTPPLRLKEQTRTKTAAWSSDWSMLAAKSVSLSPALVLCLPRSASCGVVGRLLGCDGAPGFAGCEKIEDKGGGSKSSPDGSKQEPN